jgi:hypothetical protein
MRDKFCKTDLQIILTVFFFVLLFLTSCGKIKDPVFVGTWQYSEQLNADGLVLNTTRTITLSQRTFEETFLVQREGSALVSEIIGTKGDLITTHTGLVFELNELGACKRDLSDNCTGNVEWYSEGSDYWNENIPYFKLIVPGEFQVNGNTLWLVRDLNNDGDSADAGEDITFQRI